MVIVDLWILTAKDNKHHEEEARPSFCCSLLFRVPCVRQVTFKGGGEPTIATRCWWFAKEEPEAPQPSSYLPFPSLCLSVEVLLQMTTAKHRGIHYLFLFHAEALPQDRILGQNPVKSLTSFPPYYWQSPLQLCLEISFPSNSRNLLYISSNFRNLLHISKV